VFGRRKTERRNYDLYKCEDIARGLHTTRLQKCNKLTAWSRVLEKLPVPQLVNKFAAFYETRNFITVFKIASHVYLS
jgi:hypothetical protein